MVRLYLTAEKRTVVLPIETYLVGVVAAEMPSSFSAEALKAQALAARTYTLRRLYESPSYPGGSSLSDDYHTCQAYLNPDVYRKKQGRAAYRRKFTPVSQAVRLTRGQVLVWQGHLIDPVYHSCCGGMTASSQEVWGSKVAYLQSIPCPWCTRAEHYRSRVALHKSEILKKLGLPADKTCRVSIQSTTPSGRAASLTVNGRPIKPAQFRQALGLASTRIEDITADRGSLVINCRGYGHGVGLCQYGADGMARKGCTYLQIAENYYRGVQVVRLHY
jgi:stage II sporulation protein D